LIFHETDWPESAREDRPEVKLRKRLELLNRPHELTHRGLEKGFSNDRGAAGAFWRQT